MDPADEPPGCPGGVHEQRIVALFGDPSDDDARAHALRCDVCARRYFDHVVIRWLVRALAAANASPAVVHIAVHRYARWPLAAGIVIACAGLSVAAAVVLTRPVILAPVGGGLGRVAEVEARTGLQMAAAGIPPHAPVERWTSFVTRDGAVGTVVLATTDTELRMDLAGFDDRGEVLWTARRDWEDWATILGSRWLRPHELETVVTQNEGGRVEERVAVVLERAGLGGLFLIDPMSGELTGRYFHPGVLASGVTQGSAIGVLRGPAGGRRRLVVPGVHEENGKSVPCASILGADGARVQHVVLPTLEIDSGAPRVIRTVPDWTAGHESVSFQSSEGVLVTLDVAEGRLVMSSVRAEWSDFTRRAFNRVRGDGAFEAWVQRHGGRAATQAFLASQVAEHMFKEIPSWFDR